MPQFYLQLAECDGSKADIVGLELPNIDAAREAAIKSARDVISDEVRDGRLCLECYIDIFDTDQHYVLTVPFSEAVELANLADCHATALSTNFPRPMFIV